MRRVSACSVGSHPKEPVSTGVRVVCRANDDRDLRSLLETLDRKARDDLRRILIHDQADRDAISSRLMRYRDQTAED